MDEQNVKPKHPIKSQVIRWVGTLISSALFIWLLAQQDWAKTLESLANAPIWLLPVVFVLYVSSMVVNSLRWNLLLRAQNVNISAVVTLKLMLTGAFASNFLPSTIGGDTLRAVGLVRYNVSLTLSGASVVLDRLMNVCAMLTFLPFSVIVFGNQLEIFSSSRLSQRWISSGYLSTLLVSNMKGWLERWQKKFFNWFKRLWIILKVWLHHPGILIITFVLSWLSSFVVFLGIWILARELRIDISLIEVMGIMVLTYFFSMLPISVNGYGLREVAVTALYMQVGASLEQASTLAVITRFMLLLETLPGALWLSDVVVPEKREKGVA